MRGAAPFNIRGKGLIRIGFCGVLYIIIIIRDPQNPILIIKAPKLASIPQWPLP